jgi:ferredoxin
MMGASVAVLFASGLLILLGLGGFSVISLREGERRAARVAGTLALVLSAPFFFLLATPRPAPSVAAALVVASAAVGIVLWFLPVGGKAPFGGQPSRRVDERDIMFARGRLVPGSADFEAYYSMRPEHRIGDGRTRSLAGLLSPEAELAEPLAFAAAEASFDLTEAVRESVDGEVAAESVDRPPEEWVGAIERLAKSYGAIDVGVTDLRPYHVYTHIGRGTGTYGAPIDLDHRWAVAFSVEMDHRKISHAPAAPVIEESAQQYVEAAKIALILAAWMRRLGYPARAHIDGNYRVIAPLVARDAGLGEIGRMGLLMTPYLGPRVRLGVVTTDMPLVPDSRGDDASVIDFCSVCRKCATNCPVGAIPSWDREVVDDGLRWAIDSETCYRYWNRIGTDCATCVRVCPYSHPDNAAHNLVRWAARRSGAARRAALWLDDLFYGRNPSNPQ